MATELSDGGYEMLRAAVNTAREHGSRTVEALKHRLNRAWPGREADIDEAIKFWAQDTVRRYPGGPPRH